MAERILPTDKTVRIPVRFVTVDGDLLPFKGFMLVPEDRLVLLEKVATAAQDLVAAQEKAVKNASQGFSAESAAKVLSERVRDLTKLWDIPQGDSGEPVPIR
jgi:chromosome segregation ATPase